MKQRVKTYEMFVNERREYKEYEALVEGLTLNESIQIGEEIFETSGLQVTVVGKQGDEFHVKINGTEYAYGEKADGEFDINTVAEKFQKIMKYSAGRALAWLKKNAEHVGGGKKFATQD